MTRDDVRRKMEEFLLALAEEQELRDELLELKFQGVSEAEARRALSRQRQLFAQLETLRRTRMLPVVNEVADFVGERLKAP